MSGTMDKKRKAKQRTKETEDKPVPSTPIRWAPMVFTSDGFHHLAVDYATSAMLFPDPIDTWCDQVWTIDPTLPYLTLMEQMTRDRERKRSAQLGIGQFAAAERMRP